MVREADGSVGGLLQFVHADFALAADDPKLGQLIVDVVETVREHEHERAYVEVEYYEDGSSLFGKILDARRWRSSTASRPTIRQAERRRRRTRTSPVTTTSGTRSSGTGRPRPGSGPFAAYQAARSSSAEKVTSAPTASPLGLMAATRASSACGTLVRC